MEQLLARHHRPGQKADDVVVEFYLHSKEMLQALKTSISDAHYMEAMNGNQQRLTSSPILESDGHAFDLSRWEQRIELSQDPMWK
jgi:hypothetical protein